MSVGGVMTICLLTLRVIGLWNGPWYVIIAPLIAGTLAKCFFDFVVEFWKEDGKY